jgi:hypothetical protein
MHGFCNSRAVGGYYVHVLEQGSRVHPYQDCSLPICMVVLALGVEKGYTQGTIASLLNSFESDAANNAHDSTYDPYPMTVTSMFSGDYENQWLDQVEEEFGSNLSNHDKDNIGVSRTTIEIDKDAKASLQKEMKGKDYNLEGVGSRLSKRTHHTNMTGKTGMTLT